MTVIMDETNTYITWPSRLKIGAKSKKDPHLKVVGREDDVRAAKEKIMQILDIRQTMRVTMKLDVSYTDHSHIIGKGGLTIKRVMEDTGCHIHFPDSNRSNHQEKSNQVSIAGEIEGVEKARARVRNLTPLIFSFELPVMGSMQSTPDPTSPYIIKIQEKFNVQVMFRTRPKFYATLVVVKGCEWEVDRVKDATIFLIQHMCKNLANQIQVQMTMEISPQHHSIVLGKNNSNLKSIMQHTSTQIMFPDAGDPNIPSLKKSSVVITGEINGVYYARQHLIGSLPLVLMFDLPENSMLTIDSESITQLMQTLDVFINIRHKPKQNNLSVIIKGVERNAGQIYEARRQLLNRNEPRIHVTIPPSYYIKNTNNTLLDNTTKNLSGCLIGLPDNLSKMLTVNTHNTSSYGVTPSMQSNPISPMNLSPHWNVSSLPVFSPMIHHQSYLVNHPNAQLLAVTRQAMQANSRNHQQEQQQISKTTVKGHNLLTDYLSLSSASSTMSSPGDSPRNSISPIGITDNTSNLDLSNIFSDLSLSETKSISSHQSQQHTFSGFDYEEKKLLAIKAMQSKPKNSEYRVPTMTWSGYGLSHTMPPGLSITESTNQKVGSITSTIVEPADLWDDPKTPLVYVPSMDFGMDLNDDHNVPIGMASTCLDSTPNTRLQKIISGPHTDLATMLTSVGLDKYIRLLASHEIDVTTLRSLTDKDLSEIGITAWGARRKFLLLIAELNKRSKPFCGSAAPGAERKSSLTNTSTSGACNVEGKW
ncbi:hypothetical protein PV328_005995 [Microctonus aethiopoides]|uniref:SAM domain-containing protein n=1 Tax=Microctonus aethiopoides TaxID=144406 RepID=A0AA39FNM7_9HYME|nr:hypothetical protein PV328_005995 [Microctonus aethiopoides]